MRKLMNEWLWIFCILLGLLKRTGSPSQFADQKIRGIHFHATAVGILGDSLNLMSRATNWSMLSATTTLGVIQCGHGKESHSLMMQCYPHQKCFVALGQVNGDSLSYALGAEQFSESHGSQYVETVTTQCIDSCTAMRAKEVATIGNRLKDIINMICYRYFEHGQCYQDLETLRPAVKSLVLSRDYRSKLLRTLVRLYRAVALMAYQIAVNMFESAKQQFLSRVFITIRKTASVATSKDVASTDESIDSEGKKVNPGLFLLEENLDNFQAQVPYLMFLPTLLLLEDMVGKVRGEEVEFKEVIRRLLHCMDRECVNVRLQILNTEYMLPRLVVEVLSWGGEGEMQDIMLEVKSIADPTVESLGDTTKMSTPQSGVEEKMLESNLQQLVAQALFPVLDHIGTWLRTKFSTLMLATRKQESQLKPEEIQTALKKSQEYIRVNTFKDQIPHDGLAYLSYQTRTYHRSAFHLDQYLKLTNIRTTGSTWLSSLQKLYAALEEPDLVLGVAAVREEEPKLEDLILQHEATGNNKDVLCCYERQGKTVSGDIQSGNLGIIQCYLSIDQPATTASLAAVLVPKQRDLAVDLAPLQTEAAWQLGMWEDHEKYSATEGEEEEEMGWQLELGKVLFNVKKQQWGDMKQVLAKLRGQLVEPL